MNMEGCRAKQGMFYHVWDVGSSFRTVVRMEYNGNLLPGWIPNEGEKNGADAKKEKEKEKEEEKKGVD